MKSISKKKAIIICVFAALFFVLPSHLNAQLTIYLNHGNFGPLDPEPTNVTDIQLKIGDVIPIDVWFDIGTLPNMNGISAYLTFDNAIFELVDQNPAVLETQPFLFDGGWSYFNMPQANMTETVSSVPGFHFVGHNVLGSPGVYNGEPPDRFSRFELIAKSITSGSQVTIDYDPGNHRDTRMFFIDGTSRKFDVFGHMNISVVGVKVQGIPDILMEPDQSLIRYMDLDTFLVNPPDNLAALSWEVNADDSVIVEIDNFTHEVSFTAVTGFTGFRDFIFKVTDQNNVSDSDTMRVIVSYRPIISDVLKNGLFTFEEDSTFTGLWLDTLATDPDNDPSTLIWSVYSLKDSINITVDNDSARTFYIWGQPNWFGFGEVVFRVEDIYGSFDTTRTSVSITPVNDPPFFIKKIPDIHILPGECDSSLVLRDYVYDVDTSPELLNFTLYGNTNVFIDENVNVASGFIICHKPGFLGTEKIFVDVWDLTQAEAATETFFVTVGPKPPVILDLPDILIKSRDTAFDTQYVDLADYVIDEDDPLSSLIWATELLDVKQGDDKLTVTINGTIVNFFIPARLHKVEKIVFTVRDPKGGVAADTVRVLVIYDDRPLIFGLPEEMFVPAGGSVVAFDLDSMVYDNDPPEALQWAVTGLSKIVVTIDDTNVVTISSPDETYFTTETAVFSVTDTDQKTHSDSMRITPVKFNTPIVLDIPDVSITRNKTVTLDLMTDYMIIFPDSAKKTVVWSVLPVTDDDVNVVLNPVTGIVTFSVRDITFIGSKNFTFTATNTANNESDSDGMSVIVTFGVEPILGKLPDLIFQSGDTLFNAIHLNKYVFDDDTPDDSLKWTFKSIKQRTNANEAKLARGQSHILDIWADPGFVETDVVVLTAEDPEGNSVSDTINVAVTSSFSLDLEIIPSPVSLNFIDIVVFASDSLLGAPTLSITFNDVSEDIDANKIPDALIWKGDYFFQDGVTGEATIIAVAADLFGGEIRDSTIFVIGTATIFGSFAFKDEYVALNIPRGFLDENERIMVMRDEERNFRRIFQQNDSFPERLGMPVLSYFFGPSGIRGLGMSKLDFDLTGIGLKEGFLDKYGVYYLNEPENKTEYIPVSDGNNILNKSAKINKLGRYFIAPDFSAPDIESIELIDPRTLTFNVKVFEEESGIDEVFTFIEGDEFNNKVEFTDDGLEVRVREFKQSGDFVLNLSIIDRAGNQSYAKKLSFKLDKPPLPERYALNHNYPNPFNSSTVIQFQLPVDEYVLLEIFNIRGQEIIRLVDKKMPAGYYTVSWDGKNSRGVNVSTGVYIYRLRTKSFSRAMKMAVLR